MAGPAEEIPAPEGVAARSAEADSVAPGFLRRRLPGGWSTRQWLTAGVSAALAVLLALSCVGVWVFARSTAISNRLVDGSTPALVASIRLESALLNQETGIRGYGLTGEQTFLQPYQQGLAQQSAQTARLRVLLSDGGHGDRVALADLDQVLRRAQSWQQLIARPVAASPAGKPAVLATDRAAQGKQMFDALRVTMTALEQDLQSARDHSRSDLTGARQLRTTVFSLIAAVVAALAVLVFAGLRRGVNRPLEQLSRDVRRVAAGDFTHPVAATGPADIHQLAADVEQMRRRLADQLAVTDEARGRLDEQAAELRRSNAELEQFAYVASHDLQEPLRKVASFCQLLERRYRDQLDERGVTYIGYAVDGANRMQVLINELLTFSRVGRVHTEHVEVDLDQVFAGTTDTLSVAIEESGATITHDRLPTVYGNAGQLGMLLQNLLSNALKFRSPDREPHIRVTATRDGDGDGDLWQLAVTDNGIGIDPEFADKVFVLFQRLHTRDAYPGTGIGLALCKKIAEFHGGTITLDTAHSPGTRIVFTLPAAPDPARPHIASATRQENTVG
ncbi:His Kinase A (phospho-acceptor) domain-containing protein [Streptomyces sp. DvalAA-14]|uniref:sensor histidine kinase n=1 Tax=unclassified Streptomyces TaxID=2593676 RepID=UPI00081B643E|nr:MULTISPECIES: ATP-binding protein [unclassified Streptomyces]MYS20971.1 HAMP domain-containing protein [Streptomyces sp. SID4948]SCD81076.1 His Kinase A (phospho-acceptor) domain-containing protein [Streptomyces sp. DvalAA-14]